MGLRDKSIQFIRRLSMFYLLLIVLIICFGLYYFNYVPRNKNELNESGQRSLIQLATNFTQKSLDIKDIFDKTDSVQDLINKRGSYRYLNNNISYTLDRRVTDSTEKPILPRSKAPFIRTDKTGQWCIQYPADSLPPETVVLIRMKDFIRPLLEGRDDIFDTYMLFKDHDASGSSINLDILYRNDELSTSAMINADSLLKTRKNSDFSGIVDLSIAGSDYKLFIRPFDFFNQHIYLAGLISKNNYNKKVESTPLNFIPYSIVLFLIILISMPFLKIYLLSARERINARDVLSAALSFFLGSSILVLVVFYIFINIFTRMTFNNRLEKFGDRLHADITNEFRQADRQLRQYDTIYENFTPEEKKVLVYRQKDTAIRNKVFTALLPSSYYNISRLFWIDSSGNTIAKWNTFNFNSPLSSVKNYDIFKIFQKQVPTDTSYINSERNIIYTGKSNTTGEFQVYIAKPLRKQISDTGGHPINSINISLAVFLNSGTHPVIPTGFGFCLIDQAGRILMDADEYRNLTENLLKETGNNAHLIHSIQYKSETIINNVQLYGQPCQMKVLPVRGQPLYLVVYYNKRLLTNNILRLLDFTIETLTCIYTALAICILLSGLSSFFTPTRLRFRLNKIEWVRYSTANKNAYAFLKVYYLYLAILTITLFLLILWGRLDMRSLFYISLVLPFYSILAFILAGIRSIPRSSLQKLKRYLQFFFLTEMSILLAALSIFFFLILINIVCLSFFKNDLSSLPGSKFLFILFQVLALVGLLLTRRTARKKQAKWAKKERIIGVTDTGQRFSRPSYIISLYLAIFLIGVLPTMGVLTYGFNSEKIQYKKNKLLQIAKNSEDRCFYLINKVIPAYRPLVRARFNQTYFDSLLFRSGMYFVERDSVAYRSVGQMDSLKKQGEANGEISDQPYSHLMDNYFLHTSQDHDTYSITGMADDSSWQFYTSRDSLDWINLKYKNKIAQRMGYQFLTRSSIQNPLIDFLNLPFIAIFLFLLLIISFSAWFNWLIKGTADRLFLFTFTRDCAFNPAANLLMKYLADPACCPQPPVPSSPPLSSPPVQSTFYQGFRELTEPEFNTDKPIKDREAIIVGNEQRFVTLYNCIWNALSVEEQYIVFDFCLDGYTNYKNKELLNTLIDKGILTLKDDAFRPFSLSFRDHVLSKKDSESLTQFTAQQRSGGFWSTLRIPLFTLVAVVAIFTAFTESDFTNQLTALLTSLLALFPLILKFLENFKNKPASPPPGG